MKEKVLKDWKFKAVGENEFYPTQIPSDVTVDLFRNGLIEDPYVGMNYKKLTPYLYKDYEYVTSFDCTDEMKECERLCLRLKGVDTYSDIYVNEKYVGFTQNMFLQYEFDIKPFLQEGRNELKIVLRSTLQKMDGIDTKDYFAIFNIKRIFVRKAQCHFGWDWAPNLPGYGIWQEVSICPEYEDRIRSVYFKTQTDGYVSVFCEMNYNVRLEKSEYAGKDVLRIRINKRPGACREYYEKILPVTGEKNFTNIFIENVKLWYPNGLGKQNLYEYSVELLRDGLSREKKTGRFGVREVQLIERPMDEERMSFKFRINGKDVFIKGSNWVPCECFTGTISDEKYKALIRMAKNANYNMLRVWGGGIYEKDIFYDLCDELGIMVWQDIMLACADIPEKEPEFLSLMQEEVDYQVRRLRNHPSVVYWCGGNEKTGAFGLRIQHGDWYVDNLLRGQIVHLDNTRPYVRQSPYSMTDVGNDLTSGECHINCFEAAIGAGMEHYREILAKQKVSFSSECAVLGPCKISSLKKFIPEGKLWPTNEYYEDRFVTNPYSKSKLTFVGREKKAAQELFGEVNTLSQFVAKGMAAHAEVLKSEIEWARANAFETAGFMNWMFSDIWGTGTWAVVDYYLQPKAAFYAMQRAFEPVFAAIVYDGERHLAYAMNDTFKTYKGEVLIREKTQTGQILQEKKISVDLKAGERVKLCEVQLTQKGAFFTIEINGLKNFYYPALFKDLQPTSSYEYSVTEKGKKGGEYMYEIEVTAKGFVRMFEIDTGDDVSFVSDNYFDMEAGDHRVICVRTSRPVDIHVSDYASSILQ